MKAPPINWKKSTRSIFTFSFDIRCFHLFSHVMLLFKSTEFLILFNEYDVNIIVYIYVHSVSKILNFNIPIDLCTLICRKPALKSAAVGRHFRTFVGEKSVGIASSTFTVSSENKLVFAKVNPIVRRQQSEKYLNILPSTVADFIVVLKSFFIFGAIFSQLDRSCIE